MDSRGLQLLNDMGVDVWFERGSATASTFASTPAEPRPIEAFDIVGLAVPGVLLLCDGFRRREEVLLATDVVRAVMRSWQAKPKQLVFQWPQVDVSGDPHSVLHAFVEKLVADFDCAVLLVTESVMRRLQSCPIEPIVIANLATLTLPEDKRTLWRRLLTIEM